MLLAALIDAGASVEQVRAHVSRIVPEPIILEIVEARRHGFRATHVRVIAADAVEQRRLPDVLQLLETAGLPDPITSFAQRVFRSLAMAEAHVHGVAPEEVHFHEVGALDALADVVGCGSALHSLGLLADRRAVASSAEPRIVVSTIAVGAGNGRSTHGTFPVPAPAVLSLLANRGAPMMAGGQLRELCTPTGAALLINMANTWGDLPAMTATAVGVGAGTTDPEDYPNVLRVVVGEMVERRGEHIGRVDELTLIESNVDDLDPRLWPSVLESLHQAGALDAWATPVLMRKGRPGYVVAALVSAEQADSVFVALVVHTTTLGARFTPAVRKALDRDQISVEIDGVTVHVKRGLLHGQVVTSQPEYADAAYAATQLGLPVRVVLDRLRAHISSMETPTSGNTVAAAMYEGES